MSFLLDTWTLAFLFSIQNRNYGHVFTEEITDKICILEIQKSWSLEGDFFFLFIFNLGQAAHSLLRDTGERKYHFTILLLSEKSTRRSYVARLSSWNTERSNCNLQLCPDGLHPDAVSHSVHRWDFCLAAAAAKIYLLSVITLPFSWVPTREWRNRVSDTDLAMQTTPESPILHTKSHELHSHWN